MTSGLCYKSISNVRKTAPAGCRLTHALHAATWAHVIEYIYCDTGISVEHWREWTARAAVAWQCIRLVWRCRPAMWHWCSRLVVTYCVSLSSISAKHLAMCLHNCWLLDCIMFELSSDAKPRPWSMCSLPCVKTCVGTGLLRGLYRYIAHQSGQGCFYLWLASQVWPQGLWFSGADVFRFRSKYIQQVIDSLQLQVLLHKLSNQLIYSIPSWYAHVIDMSRCKLWADPVMEML